MFELLEIYVEHVRHTTLMIFRSKLPYLYKLTERIRNHNGLNAHTQSFSHMHKNQF